MRQIVEFLPAQILNSQGDDPLSAYILQFLAQGDSWFSVGSIPPTLTTNLFDSMGTSAVQACVVNCAASGAMLSLMVDTTKDHYFVSFLNGIQSRRWAGLLLSGGGNDLIAAIGVDPVAQKNHPEQRILLTETEWLPGTGGERYLSNPGWKTFSDHIMQVFDQLLAARDKGVNKGLPIVWHTYDVLTPRNSPAGPGLGPWLCPAMVTYGIPEEDWTAVASVLLDRLETLIDHIAATTADGSVHVIHSQGTLTPAGTKDSGATADWRNEIHPTKAGYRKLSALWRPVLDIFAEGVDVSAASAP